MRVRLDIDLGELPDEPEALYACAHLANVACGGHAGDAQTIARAVRLAASSGTQIGAHPSYPDRAGFGRQAMSIAAADLAASIRDQCALFAAHATAQHVKMHGALYHAIDRDPALARVVLDACRDVLGAVDVLGPPDGATAATAVSLGMRFWREGFADRGLRADGSLIPRGEPGALIEDAARAGAQARDLVASDRYDVLCVHGDGAHAVAIARAVRDALDK